MIGRARCASAARNTGKENANEQIMGWRERADGSDWQSDYFHIGDYGAVTLADGELGAFRHDHRRVWRRGSGGKVLVKDSATAVTSTVSTNADGLYSLPSLPPAGYAVTVSAKGFESLQTSVTLTVGAHQVLNLSLQVGNLSEVVTVSDIAPTVDLADAALGGLNDEATVVSLPLNGRSWTDLANLQPGVYTIHTQPAVTSGDRGSRGYGDQLSISGARPVQNNYLVDGVSIEDGTKVGRAAQWAAIWASMRFQSFLF